MNFLNDVLGAFTKLRQQGGQGENIGLPTQNEAPLRGWFNKNVFNLDNPVGALKSFLGIQDQNPAAQGTGGEAELKAAQAQQAQGFSADEEALARRSGFPSAAAMRAWARQSQNKVGGTVSPKAGMGLGTAMAGHPANTIGAAAEALGNANSRY